MKVYLTAIIKAKQEYQKDVKAVLQNMVVNTRKEKACLQYDLHQKTDDENTFVFYEIWESKEDLDLHNTQPYIQEFIALVTEKLAGQPEVYLTEKL